MSRRSSPHPMGRPQGRCRGDPLWLRNEELKPEYLRVLEEGGQIVGYGDIWPRATRWRSTSRRPGTGTPFFAWAEEHARSASIPRVRVQIPEGHELAAFAQDRGYRFFRASLTMEIDPTAPARQRWSAGGARAASVCARARGGRARGVQRGVRGRLELARDQRGELRGVLPRGARFDPSLWQVAWDGSEIAGAVNGCQSASGRIATAGSGRWACGRRGVAEGSARRSCVRRSPRSGREAFVAPASVSTRRIPPARGSSTNASACVRSVAATTGCSTCERAACALPGLPDSDRRRDRPEYQCHSCGREFAAGLVRVPRAWGAGGEAMAEAAHMALPWPEAAVVAEATLPEQIAATVRELPARPLVLGGCCCAHVGAVRELARRHGRLGVVWIDAHGDSTRPRAPVRKRVGHAAADADRRRRRRPERRDPARRPQPRPTRGGVPRSEPGSAGSSATCPSGSTSRSTATSSTRRSSTSSCPSRAGSRSTSWRRCSPRSRRRRRRLHRARGSPRNERGPRPARPCARAVTELPAPAGSKLSPWPRPGSTSGSSTSTLRPRQRSSTRRRARSAARTIATTSSRLRCGCAPMRPPLPDARARADRVVRRQGLVHRGAAEVRSDDPLDSSTCARTPSGFRRRS